MSRVPAAIPQSSNQSLSLGEESVIQQHPGDVLLDEYDLDSSDKSGSSGHQEISQENLYKMNSFKADSRLKADHKAANKQIPMQSYLKNINKFNLDEPETTKDNTYLRQAMKQTNNLPGPNSFNMDSFLNQQHPIPKRPSSQKQPQLSQDESITLITLPQHPSISVPRRKKKRVQPESQELGWRFKEARLNFIDNCMPGQFKIKNNAYQMFKYINRKQGGHALSFIS